MARGMENKMDDMMLYDGDLNILHEQQQPKYENPRN
jgi:hypothetical protein